MFKQLSLLFSILFFLFFTTSNSYSIGLGFNIPLSSGSASYDISNGPSWDADHTGLGLGFTMDTRLAENKIFNYRLNFAYHNMQSDADNAKAFFNNNNSINFGYNQSIHKIMFDNTFGFGFLRTNFMRMWAGPQFRLGFAIGSGDADCYYCPSTDKLNINSYNYGLGLAPVLGLNFNLGSVVSLCADMGYRWSIIGGYAEFDFIESSWGSSMVSTHTEPILSFENEFFVNLSLIFRINDNFIEYRSGKKSRR